MIDIANYRLRIGLYWRGKRSKHKCANKYRGTFGAIIRTTLRITALCMLLFLAGDIEINPGPAHTRQTTLDEVKNPATPEQVTLGARANEASMENILLQIQTMNVNLNKKMDDISGDVKSMKGTIDTLSSNMDTLNDRMMKIEEENEQLKITNIQLNKQIDQIDGQSRRNNLIVYGVEESERENWDQSEQKVKEHIKVDIFVLYNKK